MTYSELLELIAEKLVSVERLKETIPVSLLIVWEEELKPYLRKNADKDENLSKFNIDIESFFLLWQWAM